MPNSRTLGGDSAGRASDPRTVSLLQRKRCMQRARLARPALPLRTYARLQGGIDRAARSCEFRTLPFVTPDDADVFPDPVNI
ncbi:MAG TPA: hypothetical protein VHM25_09400, partial [Polyangiaceae bacterium]|nr:hypothetical protein [Polyangiaceae bacterium]